MQSTFFAILYIQVFVKAVFYEKFRVFLCVFLTLPHL